MNNLLAKLNMVIRVERKLNEKRAGAKSRPLSKSEILALIGGKK